MESNSYVDSVLEAIEKDFKKITVAEIAKRNNVNKDYLNRLFKKQTGYTIKRYIVARKISESKKSLIVVKLLKRHVLCRVLKIVPVFQEFLKNMKVIHLHKLKILNDIFERKRIYEKIT